MKITRLLITSLMIAVFVGITMPAQAQAPNLKKDVKKVMKVLSEEAQMAVIKYAGARLTGKDAGIEITDTKSLKKYFSLLAPEAQAQVVDFAKNSAENSVKMASVVPAAQAPKAGAIQQVKPAQNAANLKPAPGTMVEQAVKPAAPAQPAYMQKAESLPKTSVQWYEEEHDFGELKQGDVATHTYKFKNIGTEPLVITRAKASCGCTVPEWSQEPIAPGAEGLIKISFNTRGKSGFQMKAVTVTHNGTPTNKVLRFKGKVNVPAAVPATPIPPANGGK